MSTTKPDKTAELTPFQMLGKRGNRGAARGTFTPEIAKLRQKEQAYRTTEAHRRKGVVLAARYPDEAAELLEAERRGLDAERGPLPGDEVAP